MSKTVTVSPSAIESIVVAAQQPVADAMSIVIDSVKKVGTAVGKFLKDTEKRRDALRIAVTEALDVAMKNGLTVDMLKAPSKASPQPCYVALVDCLERARGKAFTDADVSVRDKYMTMIRAYVRDRGANPLDLGGNNYAKKKAALKGAQTDPKKPSESDAASVAETVTEQNSGSAKNPAVKRGVQEQLIGLKPMLQFLNVWLESNPVGSVAAEYRDKIVDLQQDLAKIIK